MIKTSQTDPPHIAPVEVGAGLGRIGVTFAPGNHDRGRRARDLGFDPDAIVAWGERTLVTLI